MESELNISFKQCMTHRKNRSSRLEVRPATFLKKRLWHSCFPVNFAKFLRTPFLTEHLRWLLLEEDILFLQIAVLVRLNKKI